MRRACLVSLKSDRTDDRTTTSASTSISNCCRRACISTVLYLYRRHHVLESRSVDLAMLQRPQLPVKVSHSQSVITDKNQFTATSSEACGTLITKEVRALQCDNCHDADSWKCADCLSLTHEVYDYLMKGSDLKWFCSKCEQNSFNSRSAAVEDKVDKEKKLDEIVAMLEFLVDKSHNIETALNEKADKAELGKLEAKIERIKKNIEQQSCCIEAGIEDQLSSLEARVLSTASRTDNFGNDHGIKDDELMI